VNSFFWISLSSPFSDGQSRLLTVAIQTARISLFLCFTANSSCVVNNIRINIAVFFIIVLVYRCFDYEVFLF